MGSLDWTANIAGSYTRFGATGTNVKPAPSNNVAANIICFKYVTDNFESAYAGTRDKIVAISNGGSINVVDSAYTNAAAFKTAMSGVYLIYELATPVIPSYTDAQWDALLNSFKSSSLTIALGQTVYGGNLDVLTGVLTVTDAIVDLGALNYTKHTQTNVFVTADITDKVVGNTNFLSSYYTITTEASVADMPDKTIKGNASYVNIYIRDSSYATAWTDNDMASFKAAMSGKSICYKLAPTTVQLTPAQLEMLKGYNSLSTDGGDVITVTAYVKTTT